MAENKWKSKLLSSSFPLEYEVAKKLASMRFMVTSDYTYARNDGGVDKDFSVDIEATTYLPFTGPRGGINAELILLVECKYRQPKVKWLFLPDVSLSKISPIEPGRTLRVIDEFSTQILSRRPTINFDRSMPACYKGIEVNVQDGQVHDSEIRHGVLQLQYALPSLLTSEVTFNLEGVPADNIPFFVCPILLTTAQLYVTRKDLSIARVDTADSIDDLADRVPFFVLYNDCSPEFAVHASRKCKPLGGLQSLPLAIELDQRNRSSKHKEVSHRSPIRIGKDLAEGASYCLNDYFTNFLVCDLEHFSKLIEMIRRCTTATMRTSQAV